jgi:very-short-patch-repair endonuclease
VIGDRFIVIPQAHLSVFIDQHVKGQNWKAAFRVINGKSVDFLLVEKTTLKPIAAIELDDWSHKREDRVSRDEKVKAILDEAGVLLVRFDSPDISGQTIVDTFYHLVQGRDSEIQK